MMTMTDIHQFLDSDYLDTPLVMTAFGPPEGSKHRDGVTMVSEPQLRGSGLGWPPSLAFCC